MIAQVGIGLLRQHLRPSEQVHGIVTKGGDAVNVVPKEAIGRFMVRARSLDELAILRAEDRTLLRSRCTCHRYRGRDPQLSPTYSQFVSDESTPRRLAAQRRGPGEALPRRRHGRTPAHGSTDMANVSLALPSIHPLIGVDSHGASNHQPEFAEACIGPSGEKALVDGAIALAWTAIDAATDPPLRDRLLQGPAQRLGR